MVIFMPNSTINAAVAAEIRAELARQQKSLEQVAQGSDMSFRTFYRSMTGERSFTLDELDRICRHLAIPVAQLFVIPTPHHGGQPWAPTS